MDLKLSFWVRIMDRDIQLAIVRTLASMDNTLREIAKYLRENKERREQSVKR